MLKKHFCHHGVQFTLTEYDQVMCYKPSMLRLAELSCSLLIRTIENPRLTFNYLHTCYEQGVEDTTCIIQHSLTKSVADPRFS